MRRLSRMTSSKITGQIRVFSGYIAEIVACFYLLLKGYQILGRRFRVKGGEIDIIACKSQSLIFVEVKKRKNFSEYYFPVTRAQEVRIVSASNKWLCSNEYYASYNVRYDVIVVKSIFYIKHYRNYF